MSDVELLGYLHPLSMRKQIRANKTKVGEARGARVIMTAVTFEEREVLADVQRRLWFDEQTELKSSSEKYKKVPRVFDEAGTPIQKADT